MSAIVNVRGGWSRIASDAALGAVFAGCLALTAVALAQPLFTQPRTRLPSGFTSPAAAPAAMITSAGRRPHRLRAVGHKAEIWVEDGKLKVRGYVGFVYKTQTWLKGN